MSLTVTGKARRLRLQTVSVQTPRHATVLQVYSSTAQLKKHHRICTSSGPQEVFNWTFNPADPRCRSRFLHPSLTRGFSQPPRSPSAQSDSTFRVSHVFGLLLFLGVGATAWGLYDFFSSFTIWPAEVRADLRAGIKAKHRGDLALSQRYLRRALETAQALPLELLSPSPHLKTSGIAIALAEVLEANNSLQEAYKVYARALEQINKAQDVSKLDPRVWSLLEDAAQWREDVGKVEEKDNAGNGGEGSSSLSGPERVRAVALASKLAEIAETLERPDEEQGHWLSYAAMGMMWILADENMRKRDAARNEGAKNGVAGADADDPELGLPPWVTKTDVTAPLEALGSWSAKRGRYDDASALYSTAIGILLKHKPSPTLSDYCCAAQVLNNLAELKANHTSQEGHLDDAEKHAYNAERLARDVLQQRRMTDGPSTTLCEHVLPVVLFNLGMIHEMQGNRTLAKEDFNRALLQARQFGQQVAVNEVQAALRRLHRQERLSSSTPQISDQSSVTSYAELE